MSYSNFFKITMLVITLLLLSIVASSFAIYEKLPPFDDWRYIVIHHTATKRGSLSSFDRYHRERGFIGGLAYHFVIGNGQGIEDGKIESSSRWHNSQVGAHVTLNAWNYNVFGIGIALVGNFDETKPSSAQWNALVNLITNLVIEHKFSLENIMGHTDTPWFWQPNKTETTACPGKHLDIVLLREQVLQRLKKRN